MSARWRSRRRLAAALAAGCLLLFFTLACGEVEQQRPIDDVRLSYEDFVKRIGALADFGPSQPWITSPNDGDEVSGQVTVKGWSAVAGDVNGATGHTVVKLYVLPDAGTDAESLKAIGPGTLVAQVPVDDQTREWSFDLAPTSLAAGRNVIAATTVIAGQTSPPCAIRVSSTDGTSTRNDRWPVPPGGRRVLQVVWALAESKDKHVVPLTDAEFRRRIEDTQRYFLDNSRGQLELRTVAMLGMGGRPIELASKQAAYEDENNYAIYTDLLNQSDVQKALPKTGDVSVVGMLAGKIRSASASWVDFGDSIKSLGWDPKHPPVGSVIKDCTSDSMPVGLLAHELSHGLGANRGGDTSVAALPDFYPVDQDEIMKTLPWPFADKTLQQAFGFTYSNITPFALDDRAAYFVMATNAPVEETAYNQVWFGWAPWTHIRVPSTSVNVTVPYVDGLNGPIEGFPRIDSGLQDGRDTYTILEARGKAGHGEWEANIPESAVIVYRIRDQKAGGEWKGLGGWPQNIEWLGKFSQKGQVIEDFGTNLVYQLADDLSAGRASEKVDVFNLNALEANSPEWASPLSMSGAVMAAPAPAAIGAAGGAAPVVCSAGSTEAAQPDLDLHAYLADGTHIGMNYTTGKFENPVEGAIVSGNMAMDTEWILLPPALAKGARMVVVANPKSTQATATLNYSLTPLAYSPVAHGVYHGAEQSGKLAKGQSASSDVELQPGSSVPQLSAPKFGRESAPGSGIPGVSKQDLALLAGSAALIVLSLLVVFIPKRSRKPRG
jgi:hypothetical protein